MATADSPSPSARPLAVVTGASSGIGRELAVCCAEQGFDLVIAADRPQVAEAAERLLAFSVGVEWRCAMSSTPTW